MASGMGQHSIRACAWPFLPIAAALSLTLAPLMGGDSMVLAVFSIAEGGSVPHFPPLYPLFLHAVSAAAEAVSWLLGGPAPQGGLLHPAPFTALAAKLVLLVQHGVTLLSSAYLATRLRDDLRGARLVTALLYLNPVALLPAHALYTEAAVTPAVYAAIAEVVPILRGGAGRLRHAAAFFAWAAVAALARHPAIILAALLPLGLACAGLQAWWRQCAGARRLALESAVTAALALGTYAVVVLVGNAVMTAAHIEIRSIAGRAFTYRISLAITDYDAATGTQMTPGYDRRRLQATIDRLVALAPSEELKRTLTLTATAGSPWVGPFGAVHDDLVRNCPDCAHADRVAETDRRLNRAMAFAILHADADFVRDTLLRVTQYVAPFLIGDRDWPTFADTGLLAKGFDQAGIQAGFRWEGLRLQTLASPVLYAMRNVAFTAALIVVLALALGRRRADGMLAVSLLSVGIVYAGLVSIVTVYVARYGVLLDQLAGAAMTIAVAGRLPAVASSRTGAARLTESDSPREAAA